MKPTALNIRQCMKPVCRFRFPVNDRQGFEYCPKCGTPTQLLTVPVTHADMPENRDKPCGPEVEILLDNLRSALNVGSIFRTADGAAIRHIHLCGMTPAPGQSKIDKTALGAQYSVPWSQHWNGLDVAYHKKHEGYHLWGLEKNSISRSLFECRLDKHPSPVLLVAGSEVNGIDPAILEQCEQIFYIPMQGSKNSLNVAVALGIAVYFIRFGLNSSDFA